MIQGEGPEAGSSVTEMFGRVQDPRSALDTLAREVRAFSWSPQNGSCPSIHLAGVVRTYQSSNPHKRLRYSGVVELDANGVG